MNNVPKLRSAYEKELREAFKECAISSNSSGGQPKCMELERLCHDKIVGVISGLRCLKDFDYQDVTRDGPRRLILVLESPHRKEFWISDNHALVEQEKPAPARGVTGRCIRAYIEEIEGLRKFADYELVLMNAVQWQCSLGTSPLDAKLRDLVFRKFWEKVGKKDFKSRLHGIYRSGDVMFNCCTKGVTAGKTLQALAHDAIKDCLSGNEIKQQVTVLTGTHPFSWRNKNNRKAA